MLSIILLALVPIFFVLVLGYTAGRYGVVDRTRVRELNTVVMTYALPASLFAATADTPRQRMLEQWPVLVITGGAMLVVYPLWYLLQRRFLHRSASESAVQTLTVALPNFAAAGLPVVAALLGASNTVPVAVAIATGAIVVSPLTLAILEISVRKNDLGQRGQAARVAHAIRRALAKPIVLGPVLGILFSLLGWRLPAIASSSLRLIGQAAAGMALFVTGLIVSAQRFRLTSTTVLATVTANVLRPAIALGIARVLDVPPEGAKVAILMAALPSGFFGVLFGASYGVISEEASSTLVGSTVAALLTLGLVIGWLYG